jgi:hypothetical protein
MCILCGVGTSPWFYCFQERDLCSSLEDRAHIELTSSFEFTPTLKFAREGKKLHQFVPKYAELTKGFIRLLKKGVPFVWDGTAQMEFDALNHMLTHTPLLHPSDYC